MFQERLNRILLHVRTHVYVSSKKEKQTEGRKLESTSGRKLENTGGSHTGSKTGPQGVEEECGMTVMKRIKGGEESGE